LGIESYEDFIQTDASINPGNSGGGLIDMTGRLIGINTAILSTGGGNVGVGFAIPVEFVKAVADQLIAHGKVSRGALGVTIQDLTPALARAMGAALDSGAIVSQVSPQSAAAKAGINDGGIIVALDGDAVTNSSQLRNTIGQKQPGTVVRLTLWRDGRERVVTATLDPLIAAGAPPTNMRETDALSGMTLGTMPRDHPQFGKIKGVYVLNVEPGSAAEDSGLRPGDVIVSADRRAVQTPAELTNILRTRQEGSSLLLHIRRGDPSLFLAFE
jgi:S1-C subfamily serine protease